MFPSGRLFQLVMHFNSRYTISWVLTLLTLAVATAVPTAQGDQPEDCRLFQVYTLDTPSPIFEVSSGSDTYISLGLLFNSSRATITIFNEGTDLQNIADGDHTNSCQMTVNKENGTLEGSCFKAKEVPLNCPQDEGMDTMVLRHRGPFLVASIDGDTSNSNVLTITPSNIVNLQVTSDTFVNTVFNCPSNCFQFNNGIIHSIFDGSDRVFSAKQIGAGSEGNSSGVINVLYGEDLSKKVPFDFYYPQDSTQENNGSMISNIDNPQKGVLRDGEDLWKQFDVTSQYKTHDASNHSLTVSGSLVGSKDPIFIGDVPTLDTYFKFENMDNILWKSCPNNPVTTESMSGVTKGMTASSSEVLTEGTTASDDQNAETDAGVTINATGKSTTTERFIEEMSCKDTWEPKCTITKENNGSCDCSEAKENGWCDDLESHPYVKENCKNTCGLCPDEDGVLNGGPDVSEITSDIEGRDNAGTTESSIHETKPAYARKANGNIFVYVMIGIVVVMLLVLIIWLICKKKKASGHMDLEGQSQSMLLKDSTEKTNDNDKDTEKIDKPEKEDINEGAKNDTFQEQDEVKETTKLNYEKANANDGEKGAGENSPTKDENDSKKGAGENSPTKDENDSKDTDDKSPTNNESEQATEKDKEDKIDNEEHGKDDINQGDDSPNGEPEKNDKVENCYETIA